MNVGYTDPCFALYSKFPKTFMEVNYNNSNMALWNKHSAV